MRTLIALLLPIFFGSFSVGAIAANRSFTGIYEGTGRACSGTLYVRQKTIEWTSTYSICKSSNYAVIEKNIEDGHRRMVFRLKNRSEKCRYAVVEMEHVGGYNWNVSGYQTEEGFQNRKLPDWNNSPLPERQILSCPMVGPD